MNKLSEIRRNIIEQAMSGKLLPQFDTDTSVSDMLKAWDEKNQRLIKEKKIRKSKPLPVVDESEHPYPIPSSWVWVRLGAVTNYGQSEKAVDSQVGKSEWVLELEDIEKDSSKLLRKVRHEERSFTSSKNRFFKGDVLYGKLRPYLNKVIVADENGVCSSEIQPIRSDLFHPEFLKYTFHREDFKQYINKKMYGSKMPRLGTDDGRMTLLPLPPVEEQERIVVKMKELLSLCEEVHHELSFQKKALHHFRKKMLDVTLRGNLIESDEKDDRTSSEGVPFSIPSNWKWTKLSDLSEKIHYGYTASATSDDTGVRMVRITDIQDEKVEWEQVPFCEIEEESIEKYQLEPGDILIARTGGTVGKSFLVNQIDTTSVFASYLIRIKLKKDVNPEYVKKFLESDFYWSQIQQQAKGTGQANVNARVLGNLSIPIPPISEQEDIMEKISVIWENTEEMLGIL